MIRYILAALLLASPAFAQAPRVGGLDVRNNLGEIAAAGAAAQAAARANIGAAKPDPQVLNAGARGLVCDGSTDNAAVITALNSTATTGTTIYFPPAALPCLSSVTLAPPAGSTVWAYPGTVTLKPTAGSTASPVLISVANKSNVLIYGLTIDGGGRDFGTANNVATIFQASNVVFDHVTLQNTRGVGIIFSTAVTNSGVRDSTFTNNGNHWLTTGLNADQQQGVAFCCGTTAANSGNFATRNTFSDTGLDSISATNQTDFVATGNKFKSVGGRYTNGGAAVYANLSNGISVNNNSVNIAFGNGIDINSTNLATINNNNVQFAGAAGISYAAGSWASILSNVSCNNNQNGGISSQKAGITLYGVVSPVTETTVAGNTVCDNQGSPTQKWGIQEAAGGTYTNVWIDQSNTPDGNVTAPFGEALTGYSAAKVSAAVTGLTQIGTTPNFGINLGVGGTGAFGLGAHDGTIAGGPVLGANASDLQINRASNTQGATGQGSAIGGGVNNTASSQFGNVCGGTWNTADGNGSTACGEFAQTRFRGFSWVFGGGQIAASGDSQAGVHILRAVTTSVTPTRLVAGGGGTASTSSCVNLPNINFAANQQSIYGLMIRIVATDLTNPGNFLHYYEPAGTLTRSTNMASTAYSASASVITKTIGTAGTISVTADVTNACLNVTWTAPNADNWHVVGRVDDVEAF